MIYYERDGLMIRDAVEYDIPILAERLRGADAKEVIAAGNGTISRALEQSFSRSSVSACVVKDGNILAMYGIVPQTLIGESANIWFLGSEGMNAIKKTFVKHSRKVIKEWLDLYPSLWNCVDASYHATIKWLISCGADFETTEYYGIDGSRFWKFTFRRA